ncbi:MAG: oligosaccharide flippase family protein [Methanogenium sp.]|nr:oligosaccharide flippase family protein [Methanogenium sp.]
MSQHTRFAQHTLLVGVTQFLGGLSGILLLPIITKNLPIEEYGMWLQVMVTINLIPMLVSLGLPYTMVRFLAAAKDRNTILEGFYSILGLVTLSGGITSLLLFLAAGPIATILFDGNIYIAQIIAVSVFTLCIQLVCLNFFRTFQQIKHYSIFLFLKQYLMVGCVAGMILAGFGIAGAVSGLFAAELIVTVILGSLVLKTIGIKKPAFSEMRSYLSFGIPTVPGNLSSWVVNSSDRYLIGIFLGNASVGYYGPGYTLGSLISMFISPISFLLPAVLSKKYDEGNKHEVNRYLTYSLKYFLAIAIPAVVGVSLLSKQILTILSTPEIAERSYLITPIIAMSFLLFGVYAVMVQHFVLEKNTLFTGRIWIIAAVLNFGLNLILIPYIGIIGAAFTTLIAFGFALLMAEHYSPQLIDSHSIAWFVGKSGLAAIVMSGIIFVFEPTGLINITLTVIICVGVYFGMLFILKAFSKTEIGFFRSLVNFK